MAPQESASGPVHLLVDSTGVKLSGPGEWLVEKHGTQRRRAWRKLHLGVDAKTGMIVASTLTSKEVDDAAELGPLARPGRRAARRRHRRRRLRPGPGLRCCGRALCGGCGCRAAARDSRAQRVSETNPTQRDRHIQDIAEQGRMRWQRTSGYNARAGAEGAMSRYKRIIGDTLRSHTRPAQEVETRIAVTVLNRMLDLGRPESVRVA